MDSKVKVKCPQCHTVLSFQETPDIGNKLIVCPKCRFRATVDVYRSGSAGKGGTGESVPTKLPSHLQQDAMLIGRLRQSRTGMVFKLKEGSNVIGRIAETGTAEIQISDDEYMSRRHVQIDVLKREFGYEHRLVEINSKNPVKLNGKPIPRSEILVLEFGDKLMLGKTEVSFEKP